jgi:hypothetical protein
MSISSRPITNSLLATTGCRIGSFAWWATLFTIISCVITILAFVVPWCVHCWCGERDFPVFVHDGHGAPVTSVYLRLENGVVIDLDDGGNAAIPKENIGKPISIRDRKTHRELKVFLVPKLLEPNGPLPIVIPVLK